MTAREVKQFDQERGDFSPYGLTCELWKPALMPRPDRHNEIEINLLREGSLTYLIGSESYVIQAKKLTVFWAACPHQIIDFESQSPYFVATVPLVWFLQWNLPEAFVHAILGGRVIANSDNELVDFDFELMSQWIRDIQCNRDDAGDIFKLEAEARLRRMSKTVPLETSTYLNASHFGIHGQSLEKVIQMARFVDENYSRELHISDIAGLVDLHVDYASVLFKRVFGVSLNTYIREHRIAAAQRALITTRQKISSIALDAGFSSISRFNEAFRKSCGCTPREYRNQHRA